MVYFCVSACFSKPMQSLNDGYISRTKYGIIIKNWHTNGDLAVAGMTVMFNIVARPVELYDKKTVEITHKTILNLMRDYLMKFQHSTSSYKHLV